MFACLADHASADQQGGKLNVMGIFDAIHTPKFPTIHPRMFLVVRLMAEHDDNGKKRKVRVLLRDEDHREFGHMEADVQSGNVAPGAFASMNVILELAQIGFAKKGRYHFSVRIDEKPEVRVPFQLTQL